MRNQFIMMTFFATSSALPEVYRDLIDLINFMAPASSASAAMTALALNAGAKKATEWFYLSDFSKAVAAHSIKDFEDKTRISLSNRQVPFFCSTILYLQGASVAMNRNADAHLDAHVESVTSHVATLLASYPAARAYNGYCVQMFPSPTWKASSAPCEGADGFPDVQATAGVSLFSIRCLAASDFDWRVVSPGFRPGGVSAVTAQAAPVLPFSDKTTCPEKRNSDMLARVLSMFIQSLFTQLMVGPVSAMLTMEVKEVCIGGFSAGNCMRFENVADLFFESWDAAAEFPSTIHSDLQCLLFRAQYDPFS